MHAMLFRILDDNIRILLSVGSLLSPIQAILSYIQVCKKLPKSLYIKPGSKNLYKNTIHIEYTTYNKSSMLKKQHMTLCSSCAALLTNLISICNCLDSLSKSLRQCRQFLCICLARYPCHSYVVLYVSWYKVHMEMEYCLACSLTIIL